MCEPSQEVIGCDLFEGFADSDRHGRLDRRHDIHETENDISSLATFTLSGII